MGKNSKIAWTHHTFNPWIGCSKVSPGCANCYAEALDRRFGNERWGPGRPRLRTSARNWAQPVGWNRAANVAGERRRVFCASLADVFDPEVPPRWREDLWKLVLQTQHLDWLILTKRPENFSAVPARAWLPPATEPHWPRNVWLDWPRNVWLGVTAENQQEWNRRVPLLQDEDARIRFVSVEPQIGPIAPSDLSGIDWLIVGGESGPGARPFDLAWARSLRDRAKAAGVAFFMKQAGAKPRDRGANIWFRDDRAGANPANWPSDLNVREFPRNA